GARFIEFPMEVPHAGDATGEEVMEVMYPLPVWTCTRRRWLRACASWRAATYRAQFGRSQRPFDYSERVYNPTRTSRCLVTKRRRGRSPRRSAKDCST